MKKKSSKNSILSDSQIFQAENYFQVKFINCYLRQIISFTIKMTLETGTSLGFPVYNWSTNRVTIMQEFCQAYRLTGKHENWPSIQLYMVYSRIMK